MSCISRGTSCRISSTATGTGLFDPANEWNRERTYDGGVEILLENVADPNLAAKDGETAASVAAFYSADGALSVNDGHPAVGRIAIAHVAQSFMTAFPDMRLILDEVTTQGDRAHYQWTLTGTNTADYAFVPLFTTCGTVGLVSHITSLAPGTTCTARCGTGC